jgi:hypothetical protein
MAILNKKIKPAEAERIIADPIKYQRYLKWHGRQLDLMDYVDWVVQQQLHALEHPPRPLPPMRRITSIRKGIGGEIFKTVETVIYLPAK